MEIKVKNEKVIAAFVIDTDANTNELMDAVVAAMITEGYAIDSIIKGLRNKAESMKLENE